MAAFKAFGSWLEDSEWTSVLENAQVTSPGTADSSLKASPVTTTRRTHQVTAYTLPFIVKRVLPVQRCFEIIPWFFDLDHTNYSRWLPIRLRDTLQLPKKRIQKSTEQSLAATLFVTKTEKKFSCMAFNQADDQIMRMLKQIVVLLTENPDGWLLGLKWLVW
ncbi:Hypothetical predicted protein [Mytilus galloprovincialis]|uniref:Uncharacterized protein n=1 Tax=Mytilus galloprovincialis TaxID=29158 RepID=A0A8B6BDP6_MYTGA|nr:Hypothetical predicted protein [Mytilus galloprovincialis]